MPKTLTLDILTPMEAWSGFYADEFLKQIYQAEDAEEIRLNIFSPGGNAFDALAIYGALMVHPATKTINIYGLAASAASIVAMSGDVINIHEDAFMMIHNVIGATYGNKDDHIKQVKLLEQLDTRLAEIYAGHTGLDAVEVAEMMNAETWMTGQEAVDKGFATQLLNGSSPQNISAKFDMGAAIEKMKFKHIPAGVLKIAAAFRGANHEKGEERMQEKENTTPRPATAEEIEAACVGAGPEFVLSQVKAGATIADACRAFIAVLAESVKAGIAQADAIRAEMETMKAGYEKRIAAIGLDPANHGASTPESEDKPAPCDEYQAIIDRELKAGKSRRDAIAAATKERPDARESWIQKINSKGGK